jgi:hypothetical protein
MDNVGFNVRTDKRELAKQALELALKICCDYSPEDDLYFKIKKRVGLIFSWSDHNKSFKPLSELYTHIDSMKQPELFSDPVRLALMWCEEQHALDHQAHPGQHQSKEADRFDNLIDMDGNCSPCAYRVYTGDWGHVDDNWWCCAIKPVYAWYGK